MGKKIFQQRFKFTGIHCSREYRCIERNFNIKSIFPGDIKYIVLEGFISDKKTR